MNYIKAFCRKIAKGTGFDIIKSMPGYNSIRIPETGSTISPLEFILKDILRSGRNDFFFIQIGANDGIRFDPVHDLIFEFQLSGLLVEPLPDIFVKLKKNYLSQPQLRFENSAIADHKGTGTLWRFHPDAPVPDKCHGMARFNEDSIRKLANQYNSEKYIEKTSIELITFEELLLKHKIKKLDFLQIDTEGYEFKILQMVMKTNFKPRLINYEFQNLSLQDRLDSCTLLSQNGYKFIHDAYDTLAIHYSLIDKGKY
jgi:FkbM family methyltransferase